MDTPRQTFSPLPDRERRHLLQFYIAPRWPYGQRLIVSGVIIAIALLMQVVWQADNPMPVMFITGPILMVGMLLLLNRGYNSKPDSVDGEGEWEKTTLDRFDTVAQLQRDTRKWDETVVDLTCVIGFLSLIGVIVLVGLVALALFSRQGSERWALLFVMDAAIMVLPLWITGTRRGWRPQTLDQQIEALEVALETIETHDQPSCQIQPMFEMIGRGEKRVPVGARVFIRFPEGPEDFYGLQFQVALNEVQGTHYPYLYAVLVAKKSFDLLDKHAQAIERGCPDNIVVEPNREDDVDVIVIRQRTTKTKGYHTKPKHVRPLTAYAWNAAARVLGPLPT